MKTRLLFFVLLSMYLCTYSQTEPYESKFPATPTVASLAKYADIPVGYYSGTANVSIPLYNIQVGDFTLPISLNYNTSGIKVSQEASNVGLGWSLFAGGVITRQIRGGDDFNLGTDPTGYFFNQDYNDPSNNMIDISNTLVDNGSSGVITTLLSHKKDAEPDLFMFNFAGYSGKFILQGNQGSQFKGKGILINQEDNLSIDFEINGYTFTIKDERGITYTFSLYEESSSYLGTGELFNGITVQPTSPFPPQTKNSWHLTNIRLANGQEINFNYKGDSNASSINSGLIKNVPTTSLTKYVLASSGGGSNNFETLPDVYSRSYNTSNAYILKDIEWPYGKVEFITSHRDDTKHPGDGTKNQKISEIKVFSNQNSTDNELIKHYDLQYNYFTNSSNRPQGQHYSWRLKLKHLIERPVKGNNSFSESKWHNFQYNETLDLPDKDSNDYDHWGYFNDASNLDENILPAENDYDIQDDYLDIFARYATALSLPFTTANRSKYFDGADREVNTTAAQAGVLTQIQYPTGGVENFEYESNTYVKEQDLNQDPYETINNGTSVAFAYSSQIGGNVEAFEREFTVVGDAEYPKFSLLYTAEALNAHAGQNYSGYFRLELWQDGDQNPLATYSCNYPSNTGPQTSFDCQGVDFNLDLSPGTYKLKLVMPSYMTDGTYFGVVVSGSISFREKILTPPGAPEPAQNMLGGGLRISKITSEKNTREFDYNDNSNLSTGLLLGDYNYYNYTSRHSTSHPNFSIRFYVVRSSNSNFSLTGAITGNIIGYSKVRERVINHDNPNEYMQKEYVYHNTKPLASFFLPGLPNQESILNGKLKKVTDYAGGLPVRFVENHYFQSPFAGEDFISAAHFNTNTNAVTQYTLLSTYWKLGTVHTKELYLNGQFTEVNQWENFKYTDESTIHANVRPEVLKVSEIETTQSNGDILLTTIKYPQDDHFYPLPSYTTMASELVQKHIYNVPYYTKTEIKKNGETSFKHLSHDYTIYDNWGSTAEGSSDLILPKTSMTLKDNLFANNFQMEKTVSLYKYDNIGNPEEYALEGGTHTVIVWGYNKQYPIAKIANATYEPNKGNTITSTQQTAINNAVTASTNDTSDALENTLRDKLQLLRNAFPQAMITTYTYDPLIGVTSVTDPKGYTMFYTYDGFNRLQYVKDHNGNLLSENEYNYKQ